MDSTLPGLIDCDVALFWTIKDILQVMCMSQKGIAQAPTSEHQDAQQFIATDGLDGSNKEASIIDGIAIGYKLPRCENKQEKKEATELIDRFGNSFGQSKDKKVITEAQQMPDDIFISGYISEIRVMMQPKPSTCMFVATTLITEVASRKSFATENETVKFCWNAEFPMELVKQCEDDGTWDPKFGVFLNRIGTLFQNTKRSGLPTENSDIRLWLKEWKMWWPKRKDGRASLDNAAVKRLLFDRQCFMGILFITSDYCNLEAPLDGGGNSFQKSFPGCPPEKRLEVQKTDQKVDYHAVVCYGYWDSGLEEEGLRILVLDNHTKEGPSRWVDFRAFDILITLTSELPSRDPPPSANPAGSPETTTTVVVAPVPRTVGPYPTKRESPQRTTTEKKGKEGPISPKKQK